MIKVLIWEGKEKIHLVEKEQKVPDLGWKKGMSLVLEVKEVVVCWQKGESEVVYLKGKRVGLVLSLIGVAVEVIWVEVGLANVEDEVDLENVEDEVVSVKEEEDTA